MTGELDRLRQLDPVDRDALRREDPPPVPEHLRRAVRSSPTLARRRWRPAALIIAGVLLTGSATAAVTLGPGRGSDPLRGTITGAGPGSSGGRAAYRVQMVPDLVAGRAGWCIEVQLRTGPHTGIGGEGCGPAAPPHALLVASGGIGQTAAGARSLAYFVVDRRVSRIALPDGQRIVPRPSPAVPSAWRATTAQTRDEPRPGSITFLDAAGHPIGTDLARQAYPGKLATRPYDPGSARVPRCGVMVPARSGLRVLTARVVTRSAIRAAAVGGRAFRACSSVVVYQGRRRLKIAVLVDAGRPGRRPAPLPGQHAVPARPGVVDASGGLSGRRVGSRWLVVAGNDRAGRQRLLAEAVVAP